MYLAPINYDRFFERAFSDLNVAKQFLEDLLNTKIETIELLSRKKKITDDAAFVEFDFRCKIKSEYVIIDMQQWYKQDIVKRFYLYFCNNTSLQLERMPLMNVPGRNGKVYKTKNYNVLEPSLTVIWMANDNLGFSDNIIAFSLFPEVLNDFVRNEALWATNNQEKLLEERKKVLEILTNKTKGLDFLQKNRLIYALQPNIAYNLNLDEGEYQNWFEFAEKTRNKDNQESDFEKFKEIPIFRHLMEILRTSTMTQDDFQYITDQVEYERGMEVYNNKIRQEGIDYGIDYARREYEPRFFMLTQEKQKADQENQKLAQEKQKADQSLKQSIRKFLKYGDSVEDIAELLLIDMPTMTRFLEQIKVEDEATKSKK